MSDRPLIRFFDIETAPNLAHVWSFWNTNVGLNQVMEDDHIMSFCYKDLGDDYSYYFENRSKDDKEITIALVDMLSEADIVVAHNGKKFDVPWVQGRAAIHGIAPPEPFKVIDTLKEARKSFKLPSYRLEYLARVFGCSLKLKHKKFPGHDLWVECLAGNEEAWQEMEAYNRQDVVALEELYLKLRPFIKNHPNMGIYMGGERAVCPKCGSHDIQYRGYAYTNLSKFRKFQCKSCGGWGRERTNVLEKEARANLQTNVI